MNQETPNSSLTNDLPFTQLAQSHGEGSEAKGAARCQHRTRTGHRCRLRVLNPQSHLPRSAVDIAGQSDENPPVPNVTDVAAMQKRKVLPGGEPFMSKPLRGGKKV